jgi:hypothetical protein
MGQRGLNGSLDNEDDYAVLNRTFSLVVEKGLDNPIGDHNCFLNTGEMEHTLVRLLLLCL